LNPLNFFVNNANSTGTAAVPRDDMMPSVATNGKVLCSILFLFEKIINIIVLVWVLGDMGGGVDDRLGVREPPLLRIA